MPETNIPTRARLRLFSVDGWRNPLESRRADRAVAKSQEIAKYAMRVARLPWVPAERNDGQRRKLRLPTLVGGRADVLCWDNKGRICARPSRQQRRDLRDHRFFNATDTGHKSCPSPARPWLVADTARSWISQNGGGGFPIDGVALVVAVVAAGDVPYTDPEEPGFIIGLQFGGGGFPAKDWWRRVVGGAILEPTPPLHPSPMPSPARVRQVAGS